MNDMAAEEREEKERKLVGSTKSQMSPTATNFHKRLPIVGNSRKRLETVANGRKL